MSNSRRSTGWSAGLTLVLLAAAACGDRRPEPPAADAEADREPAGAQTPAPEGGLERPADAADAGPPAGAVADVQNMIDLRALPPEVPRPRAPLVLSGSCPGECCGYGEWLTGDLTQVYARAYDTTNVAFTLIPRSPMTALEGYVRIDTLGAAQLTAGGVMYLPGGGQHEIPAGDSVILLGYQGEGFYHAWYGGRVGEVEVETQSMVSRELAADWWVEITSASGDGWLWMERTPLIWGADGCGLPGPPPAGVEPCDPEWLERVELAFPIGDAEGHGPDLGSDEWMSALSRRLGINGSDGPEPGSEEWCGAVDQMLWGVGR